MKGDFLGVSILPKPAKRFFALVYFVEASLLVYGLLTKFPFEYNVLFAAAFLVYAFARQLFAQDRPTKHVMAEEQRPEPKFLEQALEEFKDLTGLGEELKVVWKPGGGKRDGITVGSTIYIYNENPDEALETLSHEFIEYAMTRPQKLLMRVINALLLSVRGQLYRDTDKVAEVLSKLLIEKVRKKRIKKKLEGEN